MSVAVTARRDLGITLAALAGLLAWDASGWDLAVARLFADGNGFGARNAWWADRLAHDGGRIAAWVLLATLVFAAWQSQRTVTQRRMGQGAGERWRWLAVMLLCALAVPALKPRSTTSCPWELAEFGGVARHVSHWAIGVTDGGPGHCFPSGHAVSAFAFFGLYFQWREHDARRARVWLGMVLATGLLFGSAQLARGAHYPSHTLWSAWLCWAVCVAADRAFRSFRSRTL